MPIWLPMALKVGAGLLIAGVLAGFYFHYRHLESEAAKVEGLTAKVTAYAKADKDRQAVDQQFSDWQTQIKDTILDGLRKAPRPVVATNPGCAPSDADRELRNRAATQLLPISPGPSN